MPPGNVNRRPSDSSSISPPESPIALPPKVIDYGLPLSQAIAGIQRAGSGLKLNRCQFKRVESMCLHIYQTLARREREPAQRLLRSVHARCDTWTSAGLLQSLTEIPNDMGSFEQQCINQGAPQVTVSSFESEAEAKAIVSAMRKIISNPLHRNQAMKLRGQPAEAFVTHLQLTLDNSPHMVPTLREECIKALRKLAVEAEVLPRSLEIDEVLFESPNYPLAWGGFCEVFKGNWKGRAVAVKKLRLYGGSDNTNIFKVFRREVLLWRQLSHQYVLPLLGIFKPEEGVPIHSMVSEWMENGTLKHCLKKPQHQESNRLKLLHQISLALEYLHTHKPPVAHGDIKADNIFVNSEMHPLLGDFGLSCNHYNIDRTVSSTLQGGTVRWMAQELLFPSIKTPDHTSDTGRMEKPTPESDIWALAMLMLEVFTDADPYAGDILETVVIMKIKQGQLPERPGDHITERGLTDDVWNLMNQCWKHIPSERVKVDYVVGNLERLSANVRPTAWSSRTITVQVPQVLVQSLIISDEANLKLLKIPVRRQGSGMRDAVRMVNFSITGNAHLVAEAQGRITEKIKEKGGTPSTDHISIPKLLHGLVIGHAGRNVKKIQSKHRVKIQFPDRKSESDQVIIKGFQLGIEGAKGDLRKSAEFEQCWRDEITLTIPPRVAEMVHERRKEILRPPLRDLVVDVPSGTITLRGKRSGIASAESIIRSIDAHTPQEVVEEVAVDRFLYDIIKDDPQVWLDIVDRCDGPSEPDKQRRMLEIGANNVLRIQGAPKIVGCLRKEVDQLMAVGHACITGKRITARRHKSLIGQHGELIKKMRMCTGAMAYFPISGGYEAVGMPNNMSDYERAAAEDIVKLVGSKDACAKGREYLKERVNEQKAEERREQNRNQLISGVEFPADLHHLVKGRVQSRFRTFGISILDMETPVTPPSLLSFASLRPEDEKANGPGWTISRCRDITKKRCQWQLEAKSPEALQQGGDFLAKEINAAMDACLRIGILRLENSNLRIAEENIASIQQQHKEILFEIEKPDRVVLAGTSTNEVKLAIDAVVAVVELGKDIQ